MPIRKKIVDSKVAVILCDDHPFWYLYHRDEELLFLPELVDLILNKEIDKTLFEETIVHFGSYEYDVYGLVVDYNHKYIHIPDPSSFRIEWLDISTPFCIIAIEFEERIITEKNLIIRS
jgi:hypothetical protein